MNESATTPRLPIGDPDILFEDRHLIAVNKPAGLPTQAPAPWPSLEAWVKQYIKEKYAKPAGVYLGVPQRLDRPVSGVVLFARATKAAQRLHQQFQERAVQKIYWAILEGKLEPVSGRWQDWLLKTAGQAEVELTEPEFPGSKQAQTDYQVLGRFDQNQSWVELRPLTGRTHQLRVQSAKRGHPILGDHAYGSTTTFGGKSEAEANTDSPLTIALHARQLEVVHPLTREKLTLTAPLPGYWPGVDKLY